MAINLKNLIQRLYYFFALILREKNFLIGGFFRVCTYFIVIYFLEINFKFFFVAFLLEFIQLCFASAFLPSYKYEVSRLFWLNPVFLIAGFYIPASLIGPIFLLAIYILAMRMSYIPILILLSLTALISFQSFVLISTASFFLLLGYLNSIKTRMAFILLIFISWEAGFYFLDTVTETEKIFYRLILFSLVILSRITRHLDFKNLNFILYCISSVSVVLNPEKIILVPLILLFYIFSSKENLLRISYEFLILSAVLTIYLIANLTDVSFLNAFIKQNNLLACLVLIAIGYRRIHLNLFSFYPYTVFLVSGDSGSGKDTYVNKLLDYIGKDSSNHLSGDDFHKYERSSNAWSFLTHLNPAANSVDLLQKKISRLLHGETILHRHYDHSSGKFSSQFKINPRFNLVISGLHSQYIQENSAFRLHLSMDPQLNKFFKLKRDIHERNKTLRESLEQFESRREDARRFIHTQEEMSNLTFHLSTTKNEDITYFLKKSEDDNSFMINNLDKMYFKISNSLIWKIKTKNEQLLKKIFDLLVFHSPDNVNKISMPNTTSLEINNACQIPSLQEIRLYEIKNGPYDFFINVFDSSNLKNERMDILSFATLQLVLFQNKKINNT